MVTSLNLAGTSAKYAPRVDLWATWSETWGSLGRNLAGQLAVKVANKSTLGGNFYTILRQSNSSTKLVRIFDLVGKLGTK